MKIAILGTVLNGYHLSKYGVAPGDEVVYYEESPNSLLRNQGLTTCWYPRTEVEFIASLVSRGIEGVIMIRPTLRYGLTFDLAAALSAQGIAFLAGPSTALVSVETDRWSSRLFAGANGLNLMLVDQEGVRDTIRGTTTYPAFVRRKSVSTDRPYPVTSTTDSNWARHNSTEDLWTEPALTSAKLLNVNFLICEGSARIVNAYRAGFDDNSRHYLKSIQGISLSDAFLTGPVKTYIEALATQYGTDKAYLSLQFLEESGVPYFMEINCHPWGVVPWRGLTDIKTLLSGKAAFDSDTSSLESFTLVAKKPVDINLPFDNMHEAVLDQDIDVVSHLLVYSDNGDLVNPGDIKYNIHTSSPLRAAAGIGFYLYNGTTLPVNITNLQDKV